MTPILGKDDATIYLEKLKEISDVLLKETGALKDNIGLMGGKVGVALFFFYYAQLTMNEEHIDFGHGLLGEVFDAINNEFSLHTFAGGLAGVGWVVEHLAGNDFIEADTDEILEVLDPFLHKTMTYDIEKGNYDFLHGAVGNGTYFLSRLPNEGAKQKLIELVDHLDKMATRKADGLIAWESELDREKKTRGFNLSLSHGISSIIVFLSKVLEQGIHKEKVSELLEGAVRYILAQKMEPGKFLSTFPSWVGDDYPPLESRLAWCYGDLGMGVALWQAGKIAGNKEWEEEAVEILLKTTERRDPKQNTVIDAGLCHGAAGNAHIYNRMYINTGNEAFKEAALYWLDLTLKMAVYEDGFAGYKVWHTEEYGGWQNENGFLEGIAGIGLAIFSFVSELEPKWDYSLYLS